MKMMRLQLPWLGLAAAFSLIAIDRAHAMNGPSAITIDGGPFGSLSLSGGADGYAYGLTGTSKNSVIGNGSNNGAQVGSALIQLQKTSGQLQFTIEIGSTGGVQALGATHPSPTSIDNYSTGALYIGYLTIAPSAIPGLTLSAGQLPSLEGYESSIDWNNANQFVTDIWSVQNSNYRGIQAAYSKGPVSLTVSFGDGFDEGVWNFVQALGSYSIDANNSVSVYYGGNEGRTGLNATTYSNTPVGAYGSYFVNSQMIGGWYSATLGPLNLVPEVQYVYAKTDHLAGIDKPTSNLGAAIFTNYAFGTSPYSVGAWAEYENSIGPGAWFVGPRSQGVGISVTPTWQYKYLFARTDVGGFYLLNNKSDGATYGYGGRGEDKAMFLGTVEAGLLF